MTTTENIIKWIYDCIDEINLQLTNDNQVEKGIETPLLGGASTLDSLALINLVVGIEERVFQEVGVEVILMGSEEVTAENGPLSSVAKLADFIAKKMAA